MAGQRPYEPNDPPRQPRFQLPKETDVMPTDKQPNQTHEQLRQQQAQPQQSGNLQNILAYFASQGVTDDHVVATIGGFPLKLSELKQAGPSQPPPPTPPKHAEERKRPSKSEENDGS